MDRKNISLSAFASVILILTVGGGIHQIERSQKYISRPEIPLLRYISTNKQPSDIYLIPNHDGTFVKFRLETGAPIFVNWKSHPYKDTEVLEWYRRNKLVDRVYGSDTQTLPLTLNEILKQNQVTHLVAQSNAHFSSSILLDPVFSDAAWTLYRIKLDHQSQNHYSRLSKKRLSCSRILGKKSVLPRKTDPWCLEPVKMNTIPYSVFPFAPMGFTAKKWT